MRVLWWQNIVTMDAAIDAVVYGAICLTDDGTILPVSALTPYESPSRSRESKSITAEQSVIKLFVKWCLMFRLLWAVEQTVTRHSCDRGRTHKTSAKKFWLFYFL